MPKSRNHTFHIPTASDVQYVGERLRAIDTLEAQMATGLDGEEAVQFCMNNSTAAWLIKENGVPLCIFGVAPYLPPNVGTLWMLCTNDFDELRHGIVRQVPMVLSLCHDIYPSLVIEVAEVNTKSQRFLQHIGFKPYPLLDDEFHPTINLVRSI